MLESLFEAWNLVSIEELIQVLVLLLVKLPWTESSDLGLLVPILSHRHALLLTRVDHMLLQLSEVTAGYRASLQIVLLNFTHISFSLRNFSRAYSPRVLQDFIMFQCLIFQLSHICRRVPVRMRDLNPSVPSLNCLLFDPLLVLVLISQVLSDVDLWLGCFRLFVWLVPDCVYALVEVDGDLLRWW